MAALASSPPARRSGLAQRCGDLLRRPRWRWVLLVLGVVLVLTGVMWEGFANSAAPLPRLRSGATAAKAPSSLPLDQVSPTGPNLVGNPSLSDATHSALAEGLHGWGTKPLFSVTTVNDAPTGSVRAESVSLPAHGTGGIWFTVPVVAKKVYEASWSVEVERLSPGAYVTVNLEWYRAGHAASSTSLGAVARKLDHARTGATKVAIAAVAPSGADRAHVVVNIVGGGFIRALLPSLRLAVDKDLTGHDRHGGTVGRN